MKSALNLLNPFATDSLLSPCNLHMQHFGPSLILTALLPESATPFYVALHIIVSLNIMAIILLDRHMYPLVLRLLLYMYTNLFEWTWQIILVTCLILKMLLNKVGFYLLSYLVFTWMAYLHTWEIVVLGTKFGQHFVGGSCAKSRFLVFTSCDSKVVTLVPPFWDFRSNWVPLLYHNSIWLTPSFCRNNRFVSILFTLVLEILGPNLGLIFHQNILFNSF